MFMNALNMARELVAINQGVSLAADKVGWDAANQDRYDSGKGPKDETEVLGIEPPFHSV
jgi:hypothetical protein